MNADFVAKLHLLREDYASTMGKSFTHFWCPILHMDEEVELCKAHVTNQALSNEGGHERVWTIQRKDVDNFYGTVFESDFVIIQYDEDEVFDKAFFKGELSSQLKPKVLLDGQEIGFYVPSGKVPDQFSTIRLESDSNSIDIALKMSPDFVERNQEEIWEVEVSKDIRLQAVASLVKAAHLTMFALFGYQYALSAAGRFVGYDILGEFFRTNRKNDRKTVLKNAATFFREHARMARPVLVQPDTFDGTINDRRFLVCKGYDNQFWGFVILVNTANKMNAVLLPTMTNEQTTVRYWEFMRSTQPMIDVHIAQYSDGKIQIDTDTHEMEWGTIVFP